MSRALEAQRLLLRDGLLAQAGQCVVFAENANDRLPFAPGRAERGGNAADVVNNLEAGGAQILLQQRRAFDLLVADLGKLPNLAGQLLIMLRPPVHLREQGGLVLPGFG